MNASDAPEAVYDYVDEDGVTLFSVLRLEGKRFLQRRPDGNGGWVWDLNGARRVLFRLPALLRHLAENRRDPIYIVEGEKDVLALEAAGATATCNPGGALKWRDEYADALQGARRVVVVADRDEPGVRHARQVRDSLAAVGVDAEIVQALEGKDAADHLAAGRGLDEFEPFTPEPESEPRPFEITIYSARELAELELPASAEPIVGRFVLRGMETLLGGLTGHGKTTFISQAVKAANAGGEFLGHHVEGGARVLVLDLEQHLASIQRVIREAGLDDCDTVDYAPIPEGLALDKRDDQLDALEETIAAKDYTLLVVDPFYKLHEADSSDELQARLLVALLRRWIAEHGFALLTATHCRKLTAGRTTITIDDLFGSSLFTRDPEIVLGIQRHGDLTKLHVFKSREPGLDYGQTFELLFARDRGYWLKPTVDPEERAARLDAIGTAAREWIEEHPGESTNRVKKAVGVAMKCGGDLVKEALELQVRSGLIPEPLRSSRNALLWYPLNHAALTYPTTLLGQVVEGAPRGQNEDDLTRPASPLRSREAGRSGQVDEAEAERLDAIERARLFNEMFPPTSTAKEEPA